ncbi:MAG: tRNA (cytidine(56)-2'-O)-methyltransferase [Fervidicoccaceae archaeon]
MARLEPETGVLRIGHRPERDKRVTTHVALVARAFGASYFFLSDVCDLSVMRSLFSVEDRWGRGIKHASCGLDHMEYIANWKSVGGKVVHLTMYGELLNRAIEEAQSYRKPILIVVGAEKVPREVYEVADLNVSVGNQPHSEVAALAIFLDRLYNGEELYIEYEGAKAVIEPTRTGKKVRLVEESENELQV